MLISSACRAQVVVPELANTVRYSSPLKDRQASSPRGIAVVVPVVVVVAEVVGVVEVGVVLPVFVGVVVVGVDVIVVVGAQSNIPRAVAATAALNVSMNSSQASAMSSRGNEHFAPPVKGPRFSPFDRKTAVLTPWTASVQIATV